MNAIQIRNWSKIHHQNIVGTSSKHNASVWTYWRTTAGARRLKQNLTVGSALSSLCDSDQLRPWSACQILWKFLPTLSIWPLLRFPRSTPRLPETLYRLRVVTVVATGRELVEAVSAVICLPALGTAILGQPVGAAVRTAQIMPVCTPHHMFVHLPVSSLPSTILLFQHV